MSEEHAYDGTPLQPGTGLSSYALTGVDPHYSIAGLREMVIVARTFADEPENQSQAYVEYTCRDLENSSLIYGVRRLALVGGTENGTEDVLHPATKLLPGVALPFHQFTPASATDGDRVLVGFIEGNRSRAVILGVLTHSSGASYGAKAADGERRFSLHAGTSIETKSNGEHLIKHKSGSTVQLLDSGDVVVTPAGGKDVFIGAKGATENLVLGQQFKAFMQQMILAIQNANYVTAWGPSGPMLPPSRAILDTLKDHLNDLLSDMSFTQKEVP